MTTSPKPVGRPRDLGDWQATLSTGMGAGMRLLRLSDGLPITNHHHDADSGPYRYEDILGYLSKYSHVRQAFNYKSHISIWPASTYPTLVLVRLARLPPLLLRCS